MTILEYILLVVLGAVGLVLFLTQDADKKRGNCCKCDCPCRKG